MERVNTSYKDIWNQTTQTYDFFESLGLRVINKVYIRLKNSFIKHIFLANFSFQRLLPDTLMYPEFAYALAAWYLNLLENQYCTNCYVMHWLFTVQQNLMMIGNLNKFTNGSKYYNLKILNWFYEKRSCSIFLIIILISISILW